jgi:hypothetical protein
MDEAFPNMGPKDGAIVESSLAFWDLRLGNS